MLVSLRLSLCTEPQLYRQKQSLARVFHMKLSKSQGTKLLGQEYVLLSAAHEHTACIGQHTAHMQMHVHVHIHTHTHTHTHTHMHHGWHE